MNRTRLSWQDQLTLELRMHDWDGCSSASGTCSSSR